MNKVSVLVAMMLMGCGAEVIHGPQGPAGPKGEQGVGCSAVTLAVSADLPNGGALITCGSDAVIVRNGAQGQKGDSTLAEVIVPCPDTATSHSEILLRVDNIVLASFSANQQGGHTRLVVLVPGVQYVTTDGRSCGFKVSEQGDLIY